MRRLPLAAQAGALRHSKTMLLVCHHCAKLRKLHIFLDQRMGANYNMCFAGRNPRKRLTPRFDPHRTGQQFGAQSQLCEQCGQGFIVLGCQNLGWRHNRRLIAVLCGKHGERGCNDRFARTDVALHQAVHRLA